MSYQVRLKIRLEDRSAHTIPKRCSSCFARPAHRRRVLTAQYQARRLERIQWTIQLPLCDQCHNLADVLSNYRPSKHGPPSRAIWNKRAALALVLLSFVGIALFVLPQSLFLSTFGLNKSPFYLIMGSAFIGTYYWNYRANENGRVEAYRLLCEQVGHEFGDVSIEKGTYGPILNFDCEPYGRAFEEANPDFILGPDVSESELEKYRIPEETRAEKIVRILRSAFRVN